METICNLFVRYLLELWHLCTEMSPYLLLGFLFAGILKVVIPISWITRYMGHRNPLAPLNAALLGVPLPLCSCGVIPTGISFFKNGAGRGSSVSFLISTPQTGIDSFLVSYSMLGLPFALLRVIAAFATGVAGGWITQWLAQEPDEKESRASAPKPQIKLTTGQKIRQIFRYGFHEFLMDIAFWLIVGIAIAGALSLLIPDDFFTQTIGHEGLSMLLILLASVPLYICATASVPIAAVLLLKGLSPGAALVFLMAGPATNAATITVIRKVLGNRTFWIYLGSISLGALLFGSFINRVLPREWFVLPFQAHHAHEHELLPGWVQTASAIVLMASVGWGYLSRLRHKKKSLNSTAQPVVSSASFVTGIPSPKNPPAFSSKGFQFSAVTQKLELRVTGMTCSHCKASVEMNTRKLKGVSVVVAQPDAQKVTIEGAGFNRAEIIQTIEGLGYRVIQP